MYHLFRAVKERLERLLMAEAPLLQDSLTGTNKIILSDSKDFTWENFNHRYREVVMQDSTSSCTGREVAGGYEGMPEYAIKSINNDSNELINDGSFNKDWTTANNEFVS